jgi:amino acid transporter
LQVVLIGGIDPIDIATGWAKPLGGSVSAYGAWYSLALAVGIGWLAKVLLLDAVISPAGTGVVYVGTAARLSYAMGEEHEMPSALSKTNAKGVPVVSILVAAVVGCVAFGPFKSWSALVNVVTSATAIMYAFAPISLASLHKLDAGRPRAYKMPAPAVILPAAFCSANLIIYWGGFEVAWKLACAMVVGLVLFAIGARRGNTAAGQTVRNAIWMLPWFVGHVVLGALGRYGGGYEVLPNWVDIIVVIGFALTIFYSAVNLRLAPAASKAAVAKDATQIEYDARGV